MKNQRVGTIVLTGQDSINFVNSLIRVSHEQIDHFKKVFQRIDNTIQINDNEDGFTANVKGLDLSCMNVPNE